MARKGYYTKLIITILSIMLLVIINSVFNILDEITMVPFLFVIFIGIVFLFGFEKDNTNNKKTIIIIISIMSFIYLLILHTLGLYLGFLSSVFSVTLFNIVKNIIPIIMIITLSELIRYGLVTKSSRKFNLLILVIILNSLIEVTLLFKIFNFAYYYDLIKFLFVYLIPIISKNIYLTYQSYKIGYKPNLIYRFILELPVYLLPISPDLGLYMNGIFNTFVPQLFLYIVYKLNNQSKEKLEESNKVVKRLSFGVFVVILIIIIGLFSNWFKYQTLIVATGSMEPNINVGDLIIVKKLKQKELDDLKVGDVLVFRKLDVIMVHRIVKIEIINNKYVYTTKGDANISEDSFKTFRYDIVGVTNSKISYVGYPTVWLNGIVNR